MPKIKFLPSNKEIEIRRGRSVLDISKEIEAGVHFQCDGSCVCGTCVVLLADGLGNLSPVEAGEEHHLDRLELNGKNARLACQARILGDVTVQLYESD